MASINRNIPTRTNSIPTTTNGPINTNSTAVVQSAGTQTALSNPSTSSTVTAVVPSATANVPTEQSVMYTAKAPGTGAVRVSTAKAPGTGIVRVSTTPLVNCTSTVSVSPTVDPSALMLEAETEALAIVADIESSLNDYVQNQIKDWSNHVNTEDEDDIFNPEKSPKTYYRNKIAMSPGMPVYVYGQNASVQQDVTYNKKGVNYTFTITYSDIQVNSAAKGNGYTVTCKHSVSPEIPSADDLKYVLLAAKTLPIQRLNLTPTPLILPKFIDGYPTSS